MQHDYKFLTNQPGPMRRRIRPKRHHILALAVIGLVLTILISITPDDADANRLAPAEIPVLPGEALNEMITQSLPLPPEQAAINSILLESPKATEPERPEPEWQTVTVKSGESLAYIFSRQGISARDLYNIMQLGAMTSRLKRILPGDQLRIHLDAQQQLKELVYVIDEANQLRITRTDKGFQAEEISHPLETRIAHTSGEIKHSLFVAGQEAGLSDSMIMQLAGIFGWDVDFALDIRQGDHFTILYEEIYLQDRKIRDGEIIAAEFSNHGKAYRAVRYTDSSGRTDYYTPDGHSMRKAFLRTPVEFSRISSRFDLRRKHPILNRIRAHKGVDYAAPRGTPIRATGDGKIVFRGRKGGYGKAVVIQHGSKYSTLYAHMSRFNRNARTGSRVKQGQIIGYIGSTGLASGPHLHYEFRVNGVHRNPLTVKLPHARPIAKRYQDDFNKTAKQLIAQLNIVRENLLAMNR